MTLPPTPPSNLWATTASAPAVSYDRATGDSDTDVLVIGGGFTGLSTALHLAESGTSVSLVEAEEIGYGASGRNGGQVNPGLKLDEETLAHRFGEPGRGLFRLGEEAVDFLDELVCRKGLGCSFIRPGLIRLAHLPAAMKAVEQTHRALTARKVESRLLSAQEVEELVGTRRYCGGLLDPRGACVHPLDLVRELARVAGNAGARIFVRSRVQSLQRVGGRWRAILADGSITAGAVAVTTNAYTDRLVAGLAQSILPVNSFQIATAPIGPGLSDVILPGRHAVYDSRRLVLYFRKSPDGRVVLGGRASFSSTSNDQKQAADYDVLIRTLHGIFPMLKGVPITHRWAGLVCLTPDFLPHYHAPAPGLHAALGFNGRGVAMANRTGAWLAHKILGQPDSGDIPVTRASAIPFHFWREPILNSIMQWNKLMDLVGA